MNANACEDSVLQDIHEAIDQLDEAQKRTVQDYLCLSSELQLEAGMHGSDEVRTTIYTHTYYNKHIRTTVYNFEVFAMPIL
jgi:hypothetical protein